jgi:hypothetical protein
MSDAPKTMTPKQFRAEGYLRELNRCFLHPLGLALEVVVDDDGTERFGEVQDQRDDYLGIWFDSKQLQTPEAEAQRAHIGRLLYGKRMARMLRFGSHVQPCGPPSTDSTDPEPTYRYHDFRPVAAVSVEDLAHYTRNALGPVDFALEATPPDVEAIRRSMQQMRDFVDTAVAHHDEAAAALADFRRFAGRQAPGHADVDRIQQKIDALVRDVRLSLDPDNANYYAALNDIRAYLKPPAEFKNFTAHGISVTRSEDTSEVLPLGHEEPVEIAHALRVEFNGTQISMVLAWLDVSPGPNGEEKAQDWVVDSAHFYEGDTYYDGAPMMLAEIDSIDPVYALLQARIWLDQGLDLGDVIQGFASLHDEDEDDTDEDDADDGTSS